MGKICEKYVIVRKERHRELEAGFVGNNTFKFYIIGCYECSGFDYGCKNYSSKIVSSSSLGHITLPQPSPHWRDGAI